MPRGGAAIQGFACHGACRPAQDVGGDFFDFFPLGADRMALGVGDISGKGGFAGLLAAAVQARMQTLVAGGVHAPADLVARLNRLTIGTIEENRFATLFFARYDGAARMLHYVNAGHPPALVVSSTGQVHELPASTPAIGWIPDLHPEERSVQLQPGDRLLIYTDGISETLDPHGDEFGAATLGLRAVAIDAQSPGQLMGRLFEAVQEFGAHAPAADDRTLVVGLVL
jgi:sigma-B regulation protein RsbU (phosphoserine phosphatase)